MNAQPPLKLKLVGRRLGKEKKSSFPMASFLELIWRKLEGIHFDIYVMLG